MSNVTELDREISAARTDVERDIAALEAEFHRERALAEAKLRQNAVAVAGGAIAFGLLVGYGGKRAIKAMVGLALMGGALFWLGSNIANE